MAQPGAAQARPRSPRKGCWAPAILVIFCTVAAARAQCTNTICTPVGGDPCTIQNGTYNVGIADCRLDFGQRSVTVAGGATISAPPGGLLTIIAGSLTVRGLIEAQRGFIDIQTTNLFRAERQGTTANHGRVLANSVLVGGDRLTGEVEITVTAGNVEILNQSRVRADGGGCVDICAGTRPPSGLCEPGSGTITITSAPADGDTAVSVAGADSGGAREITVVGGSITVSATAVVDANNGGGDAGCVELTARNQLTVDPNAVVRANGNAPAAFGGEINLEAQGVGTVTLRGTLLAEGGSGNQAIDGALTLGPACSVVFPGLMDSNGASHDGGNEIIYRQSLNATGGRGDAGVDGFNLVTCRSVGGVCVSQPGGLNQNNFNPAAVIQGDNFVGPCAGCGNHVREDPEVCDDGNLRDCDGCSGQCNGMNTCNDNNACTTFDTCFGSVCIGTYVCNDGNQCTDDFCNPSTGCSHTNNTGPCPSDGNACTNDVCSGGVCPYPAIICNDGNVCTTNSCNPSSGCVYTNNTEPCASDGNVCTNDVCSGGMCTHPYNTVTCNDSNACTDVDVCHNGACLGFWRLDCNDENPCTLDSCSPAAGCSHALQSCGYGLARELRNPSASASDSFGAAVAALGSDVLVGASQDDFSGSNVGAAYLFNGGTGALVRRISIPSPVADDWFGFAVAAVGSTQALVGAPQRDAGASQAGAAYLFDAINGTLIRTFTSPSPTFGGRFGFRVAAVESSPLIAAPVERVSTGNVYRYDSNGTLTRTFSPSLPSGSQFGLGLATLGSNLLAGATGAGTGGAAFVHDGSSGALLVTFNNPTPAAGDAFGFAVAAVGPDAAVGAYSDDSAGTNAGAAYLLDGATGTFKRTFLSPGPGQEFRFGTSLAAIGSALLVGEPAVSASGRAYLFDSATGTAMQAFQRPVPSAGDRFGDAVAARGHDLLIAAPTAYSTGGAVYLFVKRCGNGVVDSGEQCDDGNAVDGDCCSSTCQREPAGAPCETGNPCTTDTCNATGACVASACQVGLRCGAICGSDLVCQVSGGSCLCQ